MNFDEFQLIKAKFEASGMIGETDGEWLCEEIERLRKPAEPEPAIPTITTPINENVLKELDSLKAEPADRYYVVRVDDGHYPFRIFDRKPRHLITYNFQDRKLADLSCARLNAKEAAAKEETK